MEIKKEEKEYSLESRILAAKRCLLEAYNQNDVNMIMFFEKQVELLKKRLEERDNPSKKSK